MSNPENILVCDGLVKIFKSEDVEVMALQGLDLNIKKGELVAIIGKSGSGKSTLLNMIGGLDRPTAGRIYVDGRDLFAMSEAELVSYRKNTVGFVWQNSAQNLFPYLTAVQNVEAPLYFVKMSEKERHEKAMDLLKRTGIDHKAMSYPEQLSGGEQQRVAIAVALAADPKILLADEPTGAVDSKTSDMIQDLFRKLNEELGLTIIIVTHDISLANKVSRVIMVSDGKISTEKIMKEAYRQKLNELSTENLKEMDSHEEYSVLDKARRVQLSEEVLKEAGIDSHMVRVEVADGKIIISK
ncbi:MAG: ABC transporter ATP-binding protein [Lachnospiraceae bacterium]|nr:ABC transporter ATP-binding protein [Lachnospiraceae bacterium]MCR5269014.1 ABC transporter ATP-binding protein [Lachnospiraceae bacterium]